MTDRGEMDDDLDEPMASQSVDSEAPLTHNSSKSNFFASPDEPPTTQVMNSARGSFKNSVSIQFFFNCKKFQCISIITILSMILSFYRINFRNVMRLYINFRQIKV